MPLSIFPSRCGISGLLVVALIVGCAERDAEEPGAVEVHRASSSSPNIQGAETTGGAIENAILSEVDFVLGDAVASCNIELVNGRSADGIDPEVPQGAPVVIEGWSLPKDGDVMSLHLVLPDGKMLEVGGAEKIHRPDLVGKVEQHVAATAGFRAKLMLPDGVVGRVGMFIAPSSGARRVQCASGRGFVVDAP